MSCNTAPSISSTGQSTLLQSCLALVSHSHKVSPCMLSHTLHVNVLQEAKGPNSKLVESLADAGVRVDARADSAAAAAAAADAAPAAAPAELPVGAPSINERLERQAAASADRTSSSVGCDYLEIINADPVSREQLDVPLNRVTRYTSQVGAACARPLCWHCLAPCHAACLGFPGWRGLVQQFCCHPAAQCVWRCLHILQPLVMPCDCALPLYSPCPGAGLPGSHGRAAAREQRCARGDGAVHEAGRHASLAQDRCAQCTSHYPLHLQGQHASQPHRSPRNMRAGAMKYPFWWILMAVRLGVSVPSRSRGCPSLCS